MKEIEFYSVEKKMCQLHDLRDYFQYYDYRLDNVAPYLNVDETPFEDKVVFHSVPIKEFAYYNNEGQTDYVNVAMSKEVEQIMDYKNADIKSLETRLQCAEKSKAGWMKQSGEYRDLIIGYNESSFWKRIMIAFSGLKIVFKGG